MLFEFDGYIDFDLWVMILHIEPINISFSVTFRMIIR